VKFEELVRRVGERAGIADHLLSQLPAMFNDSARRVVPPTWPLSLARRPALGPESSSISPTRPARLPRVSRFISGGKRLYAAANKPCTGSPTRRLSKLQAGATDGTVPAPVLGLFIIPRSLQRDRDRIVQCREGASGS
jgi:hypothetical protein